MADLKQLECALKSEAVLLSQSTRRVLARLGELYAEHSDLGPTLLSLAREVGEQSEHASIIVSLCSVAGEDVPPASNLV